MNVDLQAIGKAQQAILVIKPSSLGDVVHTLPAIRDLAKAAPGAKIHWLANTGWVPLLKGHPLLESVIEFPRRQFRGWRQAGDARNWARENLVPLRAALVLDFQGLLRSGLLAKAAKADHIVGFTRSREGAGQFYHDRVDVPDWDRLHAVDRYRRLVSFLQTGVGRAPTQEAEGQEEAIFDLPEGTDIDNTALQEALNEDCVVLNPYSRGRGKSLSDSEVRRFCEVLSPVPVMITGTDLRKFSPGLPANAFDLLGQTSISQLIGLLRKARWNVSVDSGPMHLAAALNDRLVGIHTWSNPRIVGPCRAGALVWRDGYLGPVGELSPERFPEQRRRARRSPASAGDGDLLQAGAVEKIATLVAERLSSRA